MDQSGLELWIPSGNQGTNTMRSTIPLQTVIQMNPNKKVFTESFTTYKIWQALQSS